MSVRNGWPAHRPSFATCLDPPLNAGMLLQLKAPSQLREESISVMAAFMRACDNGHLRIGIFNLFIDAAVEGRIELDLEVVYHQLVDHYLYRKPYDLVRRPCFRVEALNDVTCRITPLGCIRPQSHSPSTSLKTTHHDQ